VLKILGGLVLLAVLLVAGFFALSSYRYHRRYDPPFPSVARATTPEALARGKRLFLSNCAPCHVDDDGRARGRKLDFPGFFGEVHAANITADATAGIGGWSDAELARMIRTEIGRDGRFRPMPAAGPYFGDADLAAVLGFLRSGDPMLAPVAEPAPKSHVSLLGEAIFVWALRIPWDTPVSLPTPPRAATVEYGRYMATVEECWQCHTEGFDKDKVKGPLFYAGGFEFKDEAGRTVYSPNLTFDETGLGGRHLSLAQFARELREGITPDGRILRMPMPRFRYSEDEEIEGIWKYLQSLPRVRRDNRKGTQPEAFASDEADPEKLFTQLGCVACHGETGLYKEKIKQSIGKDVAEVARWIRHPEQIRPGTQMPTFADLLDEKRALALATWVQARAAAMK
jgi:mono/diheme cytochrome c family protein